MQKKRTLRTCKQGHQYYKSTDCPTCPICEAERKPTDSFLSLLSAPARRALEHAGITTEKQLAQYSENEILSLHGIGPSSLPTLKQSLNALELTFKV